MTDHKWPKNDEHLFGEWMTKKGTPAATQYRVCIHPKCKHMEERPAPKG